MSKVLTNYETGGNEEQALGISGANNYIHSQSFQIQADATITKVELYIKDGPTAPTDAITIRIETDSSGKPSDTLVDNNATGEVAQSAIGAAFAWVPLTFGTSFDLSKDTTYQFRISIPTQTGDSRNHMNSDSTSPSYTYGTQVRSTDGGSNWSILTTHDLYFRVYGTTAEDGGAFLLNFI